MSKFFNVELKNAIKFGLIGGLVAILICLVGMVEEFDKRDIIAGVITMGQTTLLIVILLCGYFTAARSGGGWRALLSGAITGLINAFMLAILVVLIDTFPNMRQVFVNASPQLVNILTFDMGIPQGLYYLLGFGIVIGLFAGIIAILPSTFRRAVIMGLTWVALLGLLQELIQVALSNFPEVSDALEWMFGKGMEKGLSIAGAIVVFIAVAAGSIIWSTQGPGVKQRYNAIPVGRRKPMRYLFIGLAIFFLVYLPIVIGLYLSEVLNQVGLMVMMALGLNIVVGFAGLLDLGYVAFYAIGAYTMAVLTTISGELVWSPEINFWLALPIAVFVALMAGTILGVPVLNMRGDYLAIVTLGFGEIIRILALSDWLKPYIGGSQGIVQIPPAQLGSITFNTPQKLYYLILAGCVLALFISRRLRDSRLGRTWKALREDEDVAQAMGINLVVTKLLAFATGAAFAGLSGAILATKLGTIYPHSFALLISINVLSVIIVGGMGSVPGVIVGALLLVGLPELLREFAEYRLWIYGALLVVMMQVKPEGFWPESTHKRELHETENILAEAGD